MGVQKLSTLVVQKLTCFMRERNMVSRKDSDNDIIGTLTLHTHGNYFLLTMLTQYFIKF